MDGLNRLQAIGSGEDVAAEAFEVGLEKFDVLGIIIDDEHEGLAQVDLFSGGWGWQRGGGCLARAGARGGCGLRDGIFGHQLLSFMID